MRTVTCPPLFAQFSKRTALHAVLNFDGACEPNPGHATGAFILNIDGREIQRRLDFGNGTCNTAEYDSLIAGLETALDRGVTHLLVQGDSTIVVKGVARMKGNKKGVPHLEERRARAIKLAAQFDEISFKWIPREQNESADVISR